MKNSDGLRNPRILTIICVTLFMFVLVPLRSSGSSTSTSVTIVNNSNGEIRNVYLSHVGANDWGSNQLTSGALASGQSATLDVACDASQMKVIGEDQDGCFLTTTVSCGQNSTWTITNDSARDCGH